VHLNRFSSCFTMDPRSGRQLLAAAPASPQGKPASSPRFAVSFLAAMVLLFSALLWSPLAWGVCYDPGTVCKWKIVRGIKVGPDGNCQKLPTTLYIVATDTQAAGDGYSGGRGTCGFDISTGKGCGDYPLSNAVCGSGVGVGYGSGGDTGDPCDPASIAFDPWRCGHWWAYSAGRLNVKPGPVSPVFSHPSESQIVVSQHLTSLAGTRFPAHVEKAIEGLGRANSLHVKASITVLSDDTGDRAVEGVYEYWEAAGKYRLHVSFPDGVSVPEASVSDIAYDGRQYQLVFPHDSMLSVAYSDERLVPLGIPNPFFLALQPLSVSSPDCPLCALRLSDLHALYTLRNGTGRSGALSPPRTHADEPRVEAAIAGGLLSSVELSRNRGAVLERADFSDHHAVGAAAIKFPRLVSFKRTVSEGDTVSHFAVTYRIEDLQLDGAIDDTVFTLDRSAFQRIWASDRRVWLKNPGSDCKKN
jgi:hypothetical protein